MDATQAIKGQLYRVTKVPADEYLTKGVVYECTISDGDNYGFHRPNGGSGTFMTRPYAARVQIEALS
jgi:hypothetical protein